MKTLSIFIDESGDFGNAVERPAYYLVTMVFHDQSKNISPEIKKFETSITDASFDIEYIHTGPVIRREGVFSSYTIDERRQLIYKILNFYSRCDIYHDGASAH